MVTRALKRMEAAVSRAVGNMESPSDLRSKDTGKAALFFDAARDTEFWSRASHLHEHVAALANLSSWIRGCDCHEAERMQGKEVTCMWQGCRCRRFAARVRVAMDKLGSQRAAWIDSGHLEFATSASRMQGLLQLKFDWLFHEPYTIWEVASLVERSDVLVTGHQTPDPGQ